MCGGKDAVSIYWVQTGTPGPVEAFSLMSLDMKSVQVDVKPPLLDHGSTVKEYLIQMKSITADKFHTFMTQKALFDAMGAIPQDIKLSGLLPGTDYLVRITPVNAFGVGEHSKVKRVKTKSEFGGCPRVFPEKAIFNNTEAMSIHFIDPAHEANDVISIVPMYDFAKQYEAPHELDVEHLVKAVAA